MKRPAAHLLAVARIVPSKPAPGGNHGAKVYFRHLRIKKLTHGSPDNGR